jgi:hypothetical protein
MSTEVSTLTDPRYPIGKPPRPETITAEHRSAAIEAIREMPVTLRAAVAGLSDAQLDTPYREGGWTVRQLVHHVADSHMAAFHRVRKALTEENPAIAGYDEAKFAVLPDTTLPVEPSLEILDGLHVRFVAMLEGMTEQQWQRAMVHSENGPQALDKLALIYGWHSRHHVAHVTELRKAKGW